jgi:hypothetical protein
MEDLKNARFDSHEQCSACMMGKSQLNPYPKSKASLRAEAQLNQVHVNIFSSAVISIEGHVYAVVITNDCTGYRWLYGKKTKDEIFKILRRWYSDIAALRNIHKIIDPCA